VDHEILTPRELAAYVKVKPLTIYRAARAWQIPAAGFRGRWRFRKRLIDEMFE